MRITLAREDFQKLVRGEAIDLRWSGLTLVLEDVGFPLMVQDVLDAANRLEAGRQPTEVPTRWLGWFPQAPSDPRYWAGIAPRAHQLIGDGMDEKDAVGTAIEEAPAVQ